MADQPSLHGSREEWMVFADALQQEGDPRGELIALNDGIEIGGDPAARDAHLVEHAAAILGEAGAHVAAYDLQWRYGLVQKASVRIGDDDDGGRFVRSFLASPLAASLERLELVGVPKADKSQIELAPAVAACVDARPDTLNALALIDHRAATRTALTATYYDPGANLVDFGPLAAVYAAPFERLELVTADPFQLDLAINAPTLKEFALHGLRYAHAWDEGTELTQSLVGATWPSLESLELRLAETFSASIAYDEDAYTEVYSEERLEDYGDDEWNEGTNWNAELTPLFEALRSLPLRRLALRGAATASTLLDALRENPLPTTLDELDLSDCAFDRSVHWFLENRAVIEPLLRLVLERVPFSAEEAKKLEGIGPEIIHSRASPRRYRFIVGSE